MTPGQHVNFNVKTEFVLCTKGKIDKFVAWKDGKIVFEDTPITQVADRLNKMFNVNIEVSDDVKDYVYTVTLVDEPLFQILDLMALATPITYKTLPRKKLPDGTFSKQKITIEKRNK
jgi:ferric-dicitrate binding protein FerR (iron transport regulator)